MFWNRDLLTFLEPGKITVSGHTLIRCIGRGAAGEVWESDREGRRVALKFQYRRADSQREGTRECDALRHLNHPNIVKILGYHLEENGIRFLEMEMVQGISLTAFAEESGGCLSWPVLKPLALELCRALVHAHGMGIVHRDVKPSNLLMDASGNLKLVDFSCAATTDSACLDITATDAVASSGTLPFMSPQQVNGAQASPMDDIYGVGATLYALLVGRPPFSQGMLVHQVLRAKPLGVAEHQRVLGVDNPVPVGVAAVIAACLAKDPENRPQTAAELERMLEREADQSITRRKAIVTLAGCGIGLACGGAAFVIKRKTGVPELEAGFRPIFNGTSLDGWAGSPEVWRVRNGAIRAIPEARRMPDASLWRKEFLDFTGEVPDNFELRLQARLSLSNDDAGNLGIRYRISKDFAVSYDLDFEPIWQYNCGLREFGGRDMLARPSQIVKRCGGGGNERVRLLGHLGDERILRGAYRKDAWNDLRIFAIGHRLRHELNGVPMIECEDEDQENRRLRGGLGLKVLLYYGPSVVADFRHLRIRDLGCCF